MARAMPQDIDAAVVAAIDQFAIDVKGYEVRAMKRSGRRSPSTSSTRSSPSTSTPAGSHRAKLTGAINAGEPDAARHFMGWLRPPEIRKRRTAEMTLFRTGDYAANGDAVPIWRTIARAGSLASCGQCRARTAAADRSCADPGGIA